MNAIVPIHLGCNNTSLQRTFSHQLFVGIVGLSFLILAPAVASAASDWSGQFQQPEVKEPSFPDRTASILEFGAVADGKTLNTQAIEKAITSLSQQGGGKLIVPP